MLCLSIAVECDSYLAGQELSKNKQCCVHTLIDKTPVLQSCVPVGWCWNSVLSLHLNDILYPNCVDLETKWKLNEYQ